MMQRIALILLLCGICTFSIAQRSVQRELFVLPQTDYVLDSLSIVPGSVTIYTNNQKASPSSYTLDYVKATLLWKDTATTISIAYRPFALAFDTVVFHKDRHLLQSESMRTTNPFSFSPEADQRDNPLALGALNKSGSISRSISVGNSQDLMINSNLNLQLNGKITDDVELIAAISDANIPIQPEGNTQQLQDFDKLFIQLKSPRNSLIAGDFELQRPQDSYFMTFYKKLKGAYYMGQDTGKRNYQIGLAGAVARGKYARNIFMGTEGNQGPYRLKGDNGEFFIVVLSGTERVFIDGELMKRGQDNDYIIDYNTAELSFTTHRLITQNSRIQIEFEYSDKNYARSLIYAHGALATKNLDWGFNFYSEQDSRNQALNQQLNDVQKLFLQGIGDRTADAFYPTVDTVPYSSNQVLYLQKDSLGTSIYVYSTDPALAKYRVGFTLVGQGKGNYRLKNTASNGRVFEWVAPIDAIPQGDYDPVVLLVAPRKAQLYTLSTNYRIRKDMVFSNEIGLSNRDINLFASAGNADNIGFANKMGLTKNGKLNIGVNNQLTITSNIGYEFNQGKFKPIERYRAAEFEREYNTAAIDTINTHLLHAALGMQNKDKLNLQYVFNSVFKPLYYEGNRNQLLFSATVNTIKLNYTGSLLNSKGRNTKSVFEKQQAEVAKQFTHITLGTLASYEKNTQINPIADTLLTTSFYFQQAQVYLQSPDKMQNKYRLDYTKRFDYLPKAGGFQEFTDADIINANIVLQKNPNSIIRTGGSYRRVQTKGSANPLGNNLLGRLGYDYNLIKGLLNGTNYYEIGTGQEPKRIVSYLKVENGRGVYTWNDYNGDGIEQLNEFVEAAFRDQANYVRIFTPTDQFERSNNTQLGLSLMISPEALLKGTTRWQKFLNRWSTQSAFNTTKKELNKSGRILLNPFTAGADSSLLALTSSLRNSVFFNRFNPVFGADYTLAENASRLLLINGFDTRLKREQLLRSRWNIHPSLLWVQEIGNGTKSFSPSVGGNTAYKILFVSLKPTITLILHVNFRMSLSYQLQHQQNKQGPDQLLAHSFGNECRYVFPTKGTISARITYIKNTFSGLSNSPVGYEMLEGLQPGNNLTWNVGLQRNLAENLQMNINYDARKSSDAPIIHTGTVQVRALF